MLNTPRDDVYIRFEATITDNIGVLNPTLWIAQMPSAVYEPFPLNPGPDDSYWLTYAGIWMGNQYSYYFTATDAEDNLATSSTSTFEVQDPTWLRYTGNTGQYLGWTTYVWGPANVYANPFSGSDNRLKINAVEGRPRNTVDCFLNIYSCTSTTPSWDTMQLVYGPQTLNLPGATTTTVDLAAQNIYIDTPYFLVAFTDMPTGNYWARNPNLMYNKSYMIRSGNIYTTAGYGTWLISTYVQTGPELVLAAPEVSIASSPEGLVLSWNAVNGAPYYDIFSSNYPDQWEFPSASYEDTVFGNSYTYPLSGVNPRKFFRVVATTQIPSKSRRQTATEELPQPAELPQELWE